jgi:subtilase family serine protease
VITGREGVVLSGRVVNRGTQASGPGALGAVWTTRDGVVARRAAESVSFVGLPPGGTAPFEWSVTAGELLPGEYGIVAEVDPDHLIPESDDDNNRITTDASYFTGPDLVIAALSARQDGGTMVVHDTVANRGNQASAACGILFFLSRNGIWDAGDVSLGYRIVPALDPDGASTADTRLVLPAQGLSTGRYFLLGKVDGSNHVAESREGNNLTLAPAPVDVRLPP